MQMGRLNAGVARRPCRFPIKQMPGMNASNPRAEIVFSVPPPCFLCSICSPPPSTSPLSLSLSLCSSLFGWPKGNHRGARVERHAKFKPRLRLYLYTRPIFPFERASYADRSRPYATRRACNREHARAGNS